MKKVFILCFLFSCNSKQISEVIVFYPTGEPKIVQYKTIFLGDTVLVKKQELYRNGNIKFQTEFDKNLSKCSTYLESGQIVEEKYFNNNQLDTIITY